MLGIGSGHVDATDVSLSLPLHFTLAVSGEKHRSSIEKHRSSIQETILVRTDMSVVAHASSIVQGAPKRSGGMRRRALMSTTVGTVLEWYDFTLYGQTTALIMAGQFFPGNTQTALLAALGTYAEQRTDVAQRLQLLPAGCKRNAAHRCGQFRPTPPALRPYLADLSCLARVAQRTHRRDVPDLVPIRYH